MAATIIVWVLLIAATAAAADNPEHRHTSRHIHTDTAEMRVEPALPVLTRENARTDGSERYLMNFLADMKSGTKVFQHFLAKSNLSQIVEDGSYMILIPSDNAFQRWHPIDWGFYPFSVPEFTESVMRNHIIPTKTPLKLSEIKEKANEQRFKTLGGEMIAFRGKPHTTANNVTILNGFVLPNGNTVFTLAEILFVTEAVVSKLHQMHKDKETPPLLAFPWFGAQFLSHAFLALERDSRFTQITRFLNAAEIAPHVSGSNYTFFVPTDEAFERHGFDILTDDILASEKGINLLLSHFLKGRLYERDLHHEEVFETISGKPIKIQRKLTNVTVNNAMIIEAEVFVYNLGTMFYIDDILYPEIISDSLRGTENETELLNDEGEETTTSVERLPTARPEVEIFGDKFVETLDDEIVTPRVLPVKYQQANAE